MSRPLDTMPSHSFGLWKAWRRSPGFLTEQVWADPDQPQMHMSWGRPTGSAMPLMWAHAEYVKLLRSASNGKVSDLIAAVAERYLGERKGCHLSEVWKFTRQAQSVKRGHLLRIQAQAFFRLHCSDDEGQTVKDTPSSTTNAGSSISGHPILTAQAGVRPFCFLLDGKQPLGRTRLYGVNRLTDVHST